MDEGIKSARVSLPEEQVYIFQMRLEKGSIENIREGFALMLIELPMFSYPRFLLFLPLGVLVDLD